MPRKAKKKKFVNPMLAMIQQTVASEAEAGGAHVKVQTKIQMDADAAIRQRRIAEDNRRKKRAADAAAMRERERQQQIAARAAELEKQALEYYNKEQARLALEEEQRERQERRDRENQFRANLHGRELRRRGREWSAINAAAQLRAVKVSRYQHKFDQVVAAVTEQRAATARRAKRRAKRKAEAEARKAAAEAERVRLEREREAATQEAMALEERLQRMEWWERDNYYALRAEQRKRDAADAAAAAAAAALDGSGSDGEAASRGRRRSSIWSMSSRGAESVVSANWVTRDASLSKTWPRQALDDVVEVPSMNALPPKRRQLKGLRQEGDAEAEAEATRVKVYLTDEEDELDEEVAWLPPITTPSVRVVKTPKARDTKSLLLAEYKAAVAAHQHAPTPIHVPRSAVRSRAAARRSRVGSPQAQQRPATGSPSKPGTAGSIVQARSAGSPASWGFVSARGAGGAVESDDVPPPTLMIDTSVRPSPRDFPPEDTADLFFTLQRLQEHRQRQARVEAGVMEEALRRRMFMRKVEFKSEHADASWNRKKYRPKKSQAADPWAPKPPPEPTEWKLDATRVVPH